MYHLNYLEQLCNNLTDQTEVYADILECEQKKFDVIVKNDAKELEQITKQQEHLLETAKQLECQRLSIWQELDFGEKTVTQVIDLVEEPLYKEHLMEIYKLLSPILLEVKYINAQSQLMLTIKLSDIRRNLEMITENRKTATYSHKGKIQTNQSTLPTKFIKSI